MNSVRKALASREDRQADTVKIQRQNKSGRWGKAYDARRFGSETDEQVVARLTSLNEGVSFRLVG